MSPDTTAPTNALQLSNFSYVTVTHKKGHPIKKLRFTLVVTFGDPEMAVGLDGCLAHRTVDDTLVWSPPLSMIGFGRHLRTAWVNAEINQRVIAALASTEYIANIGPQTWDENTGKIENQVTVNV